MSILFTFALNYFIKYIYVNHYENYVRQYFMYTLYGKLFFIKSVFDIKL